MTAFNFGSLKEVQAESTSARRLKPWTINHINSVTSKVEHYPGKKDPNKVWDVLVIRFEGEEGYHSESIFFPNEKSTQRPKNTNKEGHEYESPSGFERTMTLIAQVAKTVFPEGFVKMQEVSPKFKSFDDVCAYLGKLLEAKKGKIDTHLKLVGRTNADGNVEACLPKFCAVNKEGKLWTTDNFIGDKLGWSTYEESKIKEFLKASPTDMDKVTSSENTGNDDLKGINTDDILNDLDSINLD